MSAAPKITAKLTTGIAGSLRAMTMEGNACVMIMRQAPRPTSAAIGNEPALRMRISREIFFKVQRSIR
ncbi:hypothetical protein [Bradyrhizobium sp. STM 3557]|uniref:hypothetical protein n=1 Tax=Bradyrhizobium sp. STM 3557 TaxID=578920 RepID=UPI00388F40C5